jgi:fructoselysine and glucoselysine-specific PTS system IIA component
MQLQQADSLPKLIETTLETSKQTIQFCNQAITNQMEEEEF